MVMCNVGEGWGGGSYEIGAVVDVNFFSHWSFSLCWKSGIIFVHFKSLFRATYG